MKKFFRFGKGKKDASDTASNVSSRRNSTSSLVGVGAVGGYEIKDKDLGKIHKAILKKDLDKVRRLATKEVNTVDKESRTPLHLACATGYEAAIQELLPWKANVNARDKENKTPLYKALELRHVDCAKSLLSARADPTVKSRDGSSSLHCAAREGLVDIFKTMMKSPAYNLSELSHPNSAGETPLHLAVSTKSLQMCVLLLEAGVNVDAQDSRGYTPLMLACEKGNLELVSLLIENEADTNLKEANGWTADDIALNHGQTACRNAILQHQSRPPTQRESNMYSTIGNTAADGTDDDDDDNVLGKPASNVAGAISDDENETTDDHRAVRSHASDPKSWTDSESESEMEVKNKQQPGLVEKTGGSNVKNNLVAEVDKLSDEDEDERKLVSSQRLMDKNKGFIYNNMAKNLNSKQDKEPEGSGSTKPLNAAPKVVGLPPASPAKSAAAGKGEDADEGSLSARTISPRSLSSADSRHGDVVQQNKSGTKAHNKETGKKKDADSSDDEWETEPSQPSQKLQTVKDHLSNAAAAVGSEKKPDNRQVATTTTTAALTSSDAIYTTVNKNTKADQQKRMMDELGLEDIDMDESELTSHIASLGHSPERNNVPASARSGASDWDTTVADETPRGDSKALGDTVKKANIADESRAKPANKATHDSDSQWDSDDDNEIPVLPSEAGKSKNQAVWNYASSIHARDPLRNPTAPSRSVTSMTDVSDIDDLSEVKEANVTEDEDESTWEKERKLAKKGTEKRKTEETRDALTTENAQSSGEIVPDHTSSQPKVNAVNREKEVVLSSPPLEPNRDKALNLSSASASSFQQKQAPATSSGSRIPLASTVTPLGIRMSQEESTSDTDDPFSPIGSARSTARSVSLNTDMNNVIRLQEMIRDGQRKLESERSAKTLLDTKRKALENERAKLVEQLHVITREKFNLDQLKIDLESKVRHLEYQMSEETEKRKNTDVLYEKTKEQLTRKEEQCLQLTEAKQKTETSLKNEQKEKASALAVIKQLEDENESLKRQLNERNIFVVQDEGPAGHQQRKSLIKSSAVVGSEGYPQLIPTVGAASADLYAAQLEMNRERERTKDTVEELMHDNEELRKLNKELTEKWTRGEDALTHASLYYNLDVVQLKADNDRLSAQLERDSAGKETLEREVNSLKLQLSSLTSELQAARDAKTEIERQRRNHADDFNRTSEHQHQELTSTKSLVQSQSQQLSEVLPKLQKLESDLVVANTLLSERTNQLTILQKDLEKRSSVQDTLEENYRKQKEENIRLEARVGSLQERLSDVQEELRVAKQLSESKRMNGEQPDDLATLLSSLKAEHDRTKCNLEDRNASLMESMSRIKEELKSVERGRLSIEDEKRRLQAVLSETQKQQLASEASLQIANQTRQQLEAERSQLKIEIDRLKDKMEDDRQRILRLDQKIMELTQQLKMAESSATNSHEQLNKENHSLQGLLKVKHDLEENLHRMEVENAKLDAALTHERQKVTLLQKDYSESKQNQNQLEDEFEKLKSSNKELQYMMNEAAGLKTQATQEADDNRALWESEIKSRSKLGLRLAQLEREKRELDSKVQEEKRRVRRALELKKSSEEKLEEEQGRSSQLQKEVSVLKAHLKATKKRLKELQAQGETIVRCQRCRRNRVDSNILDNGSEAENIYQNGHSPVQAMEIQMELDKVGHELDFAKHQLHYEPAAKDHRHRGSGVSDFDKLRNMENLRMNGSMYHLDQMPHQVVGSNYLATSEIDRIREKLKSEAQMELNLKLQEVNRYLDDQAVARERLDRIRDINEAEMRNEFEKVRKEMLEEISKVKHNFEGNVPVQKGPRSNETQQQMKELNEREVKLRERLLDRLDNAYSKVTNSNVDRRHPSIRNIEGDASLDGELTKSSVQHGCNDTVMNNLRHQLDQSIARHMAAAADDHNGVTANPLLLDPVGSGRYTSNGDATPSVLHQNFLL